MGVRIDLCKTPNGGEEWVLIYVPYSGYPKNIKVSHAEFRAACCRDLGLVDPAANADEFCRRLMAEKTQRAADHAAEVLAAASRRLA